ncbi:MAG TPA: 3-hydroxyacyl-CoA dehydrogenase NAD-binding domain-containing protein [Planctomycetaceae bacterium]|jgi:3-hydroxyacyl-CoA dehydrogenase/enoyl-CoA hydratase/3-hydroxybutyryl-CoA epimerase/3-hydroxyacyl-CoA dehydrogenase/enoyl-CoA hydratase/3-hydroxybutyryl-CoA epimerase/enoyl-CoA isomerase|nr:3-hydroxyacyl-CoA dehydrogenase NAD-binding domain-containing protein [Planctomycetaceae bacterium]
MANAFRLEELDGKIALVTFDLPGKSVNTFGQPVLQELSRLVDDLSKRTDLRGLLLKSAKPGQFIAGADLNELGALAYYTKEQIAPGLAAGHDLFNRVGRLPFPTVALIDGNCMGGGTEISLAMDYRLAAANPATKIGLPEVKVGIIPGWGGTQRLPRVVGVQQAIQMITSGEPIGAAEAAKCGLAFDAVPSERLVDEGRRLIEYAEESGEWRKLRQRKEEPFGLSDDQLNFTFGVAEGAVRGATKGQYPAPLAALRAIRDGINRPLAEGLQIELQESLGVVGTPISAALIGVFFMQNLLARDRGVTDPNIKSRPVNRVGVLGAGQMGAGIATAHARSAIPTAMVDVDDKRIADGLRRATDVVAGRIKIGRASLADMQTLLSNLGTSTSHQVFSDRDVVIEAVNENEELKTSIYKQLAPALRKDAILATNTSTISITRMGEAWPDPTRFIGMHFFLPVDRMQLVEVIRGKKTSDETVVTIVELAKRIKKTPIVVNDCAGFLVNRILLPYMTEALALLLEGAPMDAIDKVAMKFGMPVGPIALQDMVGLDTSCFAGKVLAAAYSDRALKLTLLDDLIAAGRLGKKTGAGFRKFVGTKGKPSADPAFQPFLEKSRTAKRDVTDQEIEDRLFLSMLLEAVRTLEEGIVREPAHVDMGLILGVGFPPFRGGILRWCDATGAAKLVDRASKYASLGKRFQPSPLLVDMAKTNKLFYPRPSMTSRTEN